jgi:hypothetical protein
MAPVYVSKQDKNPILDAYEGELSKTSLLLLLRDQAVNCMFFNASKYGDPDEAYKCFQSLEKNIMDMLPGIRSPDYSSPYFSVSKHRVDFKAEDSGAIEVFNLIEEAAYTKKAFYDYAK